MWLHMMLSWGFNHRQLRHHIGDEKWDQLKEPFFEQKRWTNLPSRRCLKRSSTKGVEQPQSITPYTSDIRRFV